MVKFPEREIYDGAFGASVVASVSTRRNERTELCIWASSREENGNALGNNISGILKTYYRYSPHLT